MSRKLRRRNAIAPETTLEDAIWATDGKSTEGQAESNELNHCIQKSLADMKDKFRIPMILFYYDDFPMETIADMCQIPVGTVKSRLHKGRALLKKSLEKEGFG